jgi:hypothetical protein
MPGNRNKAGVTLPRASWRRLAAAGCVLVVAATAGVVVWRHLHVNGALPAAEIAAVLARASDRALPPAGQIPFSVGETATYRLTWSAGAVNRGVPAGEATFRVMPPADAPREAGSAAEAPLPRPPVYLLVLDVQTARWVSAFFEAQDRFETWTDRGLFPCVQRQHLREGKRREERVTTFDYETLLVNVVGETTAAMPANARDALSAFYFARTLSIEPGTRIRIPVVDDGRDLVAKVTDTGRDVVTLDKQVARATRLDVRIGQATGAGTGITAVVWLSEDGRRIPLAMDIGTVFGAFRAELASYEGGKR